MTASPGSSKRFWIAAAVGAVAFAVLWATAVAPAGDLASAEREQSRRLAARIARHFAPEGEPLGSVEETLAEEKGTLAELRTELEAIGIEIPPEYQPGPERDPLYFQKQLSEFRGWLRAFGLTGGVSFANRSAPLGFREGVSEDMVAENLARLAVARRFVGVAGKAGVRTVLRAQQLTVPSFRLADAAAAGIRELPFKVTVSTDEEGLVRLVQEMSRPGTFLSVRGIVVEVRRPTSGAFEATLDLAGVRILKRAEAEAEAEPEEEGVSEIEPGVLVPTGPAAGRPKRDF